MKIDEHTHKHSSFKMNKELCHSLHSDSASPKHGQKRRAKLMVFVNA